MPWKYSTSSEEWWQAYLFQSCLLLFVNISSICLLGKGVAPLSCTVEAS